MGHESVQAQHGGQVGGIAVTASISAMWTTVLYNLAVLLRMPGNIPLLIEIDGVSISIIS
jgi:hypothetical protein